MSPGMVLGLNMLGLNMHYPFYLLNNPKIWLLPLPHFTDMEAKI